MNICKTTLIVVCLCTFLPLVIAFSTSGGIIEVVVKRPLEVSPAKARDAWLSYQFKQGADLPGVLILPRGDNDDRRLIFPAMMEETLSGHALKSSSPVDDRTEELSYKVTDFGLLQSELEEGSHTATVRFYPGTDGDDSSIMEWKVKFEATNRRRLWETVTRQTIQLASENIASYTATPNLFTRRTLLKAESVTAAMDAWVDFVWESGGGLPVLPPIKLDERNRIYIPPCLMERLVSVDREKGEIQYQVVNPGLLTYPVHTHAGRVRFVQIGAEKVEMIWHIQVRPLRNLKGYVRHFTSAVVSTLARNLKVHLAEPGVAVPISPPRGKGEPFAEIPKDTWVGGVLSAHLSDRRPVIEQTMAMTQPWTWGRTEDEDGEGEEWTLGFMPP